jgi:hypothetical protein
MLSEFPSVPANHMHIFKHACLQSRMQQQQQQQQRLHAAFS